MVRLDCWQAFSEAEREGFAPICPDLVVELASPSDEPQALRRKMAAYMANGASLGWLLLPQVGGISTRVPSASSSSTASGLAAHTCANWEGVKVSERGRVSMGALRDG